MKKADEKFLLRIFEFLKDFQEKNQKPPSVREIAEFFGFSSTSTVNYYLKKLQQRGLITLEGRKARNIRINYIHKVRSSLPLVGVIRAGVPVYAEENVEDYINLNETVARKGDFLLRVKGDSMKDAGIFEGDLVLVRQTPVVEKGEIGVFLVEGEATVKRFEILNGKPALVAANPNYEPLFPENLTVIGKVTAVIRDLES